MVQMSLTQLSVLSLQQSMVLLLHSQHQYIFEYDSADRLSAVTMPSVARHTMQTIRSVGYYRNIYTPPESNASVTVDYSEDGQVRGHMVPSLHCFKCLLKTVWFSVDFDCFCSRLLWFHLCCF